MGHDLRAPLRAGALDDELDAFVRSILADTRDDRYSEERSEATAELPRAEMYALGG